ncbi:MAG: hypothetical protein KA914_03280 [Ottowia sp.]|nr:hypothetical protein [Ottowia sp.]
MNQSLARRVLTGITTTGTPHLGNCVGSIRASVRASRVPVVVMPVRTRRARD